MVRAIRNTESVPVHQLNKPADPDHLPALVYVAFKDNTAPAPPISLIRRLRVTPRARGNAESRR